MGKSAKPGFRPCVTMGKLLYPSAPHFPHPNNRDSSAYQYICHEPLMCSLSHLIFQQAFKVSCISCLLFSWGNKFRERKRNELSQLQSLREQSPQNWPHFRHQLQTQGFPETPSLQFASNLGSMWPPWGTTVTRTSEVSTAYDNIFMTAKGYKLKSAQ